MFIMRAAGIYGRIETRSVMQCTFNSVSASGREKGGIIQFLCTATASVCYMLFSFALYKNCFLSFIYSLPCRFYYDIYVLDFSFSIPDVDGFHWAGLMMERKESLILIVSLLSLTLSVLETISMLACIESIRLKPTDHEVWAEVALAGYFFIRRVLLLPNFWLSHARFGFDQ